MTKQPSSQPDRNSDQTPAAHSETDLTRRKLLKTSLAGAAGMLAFSPPTSESSAEAAGLGQFVRNRRLARSRRRTSMTPLKAKATANYRRSFAAYGGQLANDPSRLLGRQRPNSPYEFEILIIGSGYGGSICAARLAPRLAPGMRLAVLERGREWVPGKFPDRFRDVLRWNRVEWRRRRPKRVTNPLGLFNFSRSGDFDIITGSGLGGTSLLNANVLVRPDAEVFRQRHWPAALRDRELLEPFFQQTALEQGAAASPIDATLKMAAHRMASQRFRSNGTYFEPAEIAVNQAFGVPPMTIKNRQGVLQHTCTQCGDCISGCNVGAKNVLQMNYLPMAKAAGAEIYTQIEVQRIEKCEGYYRIHFLCHRMTQGGVVSSQHSTTSRAVIVAGGSLGSTELLLKSQSDAFRFSKTLGCNWSGNGDALGFITKTARRTNSGGFGAYSTGQPPVGPTIQTILRANEHGELAKRMMLQDGSMARAYANVIGTLMFDVALDHMMVIFGMGHDGNQGRVVLKNGLATVKWPGIKESKYRAFMRDHIERLASAYGGKYRYLRLFGDNLISVHPLGGCNMSDDPGSGVTDDLGRVYNGYADGFVDGAGMAAVHEGLFVVDGSMVPGALGANPMYTISALAERTAATIPGLPTMADMFVQ